ncbi:MAG: hypothetical protein ACFB0B_17440 [Thermonemataceae bacterium]
MIVLDNSTATIKAAVDAEAIMIIWKGFAKGDTYRSILKTALEAAQQHQLKNWISDLTEAKVVSPEDKTWVEETFIPEGLQAGIKKAIFIVPKDIFSKAYVEQITLKLEEEKASHSKYKDHEIQFFSSLDEALGSLQA